MHGLTLLQGRTKGSVESVLQIQVTAPGDDMGEQITVEGRVLLQQSLQIQRPLGGHQLVEAHLVRRDGGPLLLDIAVVRIRTDVPDTLENHAVTLVSDPLGLEHDIVTISGAAPSSGPAARGRRGSGVTDLQRRTP